MGVYVIWKFAQNKAAAKKYLVDIGTKYTGHFLNSYFYNFPTFPRSVSNVKVRLAKQTDYPNELRGPVHDPRRDLEEVHLQRRLPRLLERRDRRGLLEVR